MGRDRNETQITEIRGRHWLIGQLFAAGLEVGQPLRDCSVDLLVYTDGKPFLARPARLKARSEFRFSLYKKYKKIPDLLIAQVP